jgi:signal transduction histidine kinase
MWAAGTVDTDVRRAAVTPALATLGVTALAAAHLADLLPAIPALAPPRVVWEVVLLHASIITLMCWALVLFARVVAGLYEEIERELDQARLSAVEAHEERLRSLEALSRRVAHEIKNPLAAIKGLTQLLQRRGDPSGHLSVIASEVERLQEILDGFLSFSRGLEELRTGPLDLRRLAAEVLSVLEMRLAQARVDVRLEGEPVVVEGDSGRLKQVLMNLLLNAMEALETLPADRPRSLTVRVEPLAGGVRVVVVDSGPGLVASEVERLFQPSVSSKERGTGLGLPISRAIARAHGGDVSLESATGTTRAVLTLPLAVPPVVQTEVA